MSSRQTGSRYNQQNKTGDQLFGKRDGQQQGGSSGGLIPQLFGQDKISGGQLTTGADGQPSFTPYQGSKGFLGGSSRARALELNQPLLLQQLQGMQQSAQSKQQSSQKQIEDKLSNELAEHLMSSKQFLDMASKAGVTGDDFKQYAGAVAKEAASNLIQQQRNIGAGLQSSDVKQAIKQQLIAEAQSPDAVNRQRLQLQTGMGGIATQPGAMGIGNEVIKGATPGGQSTQIVGTGPRDPKTGQPMMLTPVTTISPTQPGSASFPIPPQLLQQLQQGQLNTGGTNSPAPLNIPSPQIPQGITPGGNTVTPQVQQGSQQQFIPQLQTGSPQQQFGPQQQSDMSDPINWPSGLLQMLQGIANQRPVNSLQYGQ